MENNNHIHQNVPHIVENTEKRVQISLSLMVCLQNTQLSKLNIHQIVEQLHTYMVNPAGNSPLHTHTF